MEITYAVLGSGMQGTCAAYDLAKFSGANQIKLGDMSLDQASASAARVNRLVGREVCRPFQVNARDAGSVSEFLADATTLLSCVPYYLHPAVARVAVETKTNMCDLGGNTDVTHETLALDSAAQAAGVTLVPDCGLAPGLVNSLATYLMEQMDSTDTIRLYCGVLPQNPVPPFNYKVTFNVEGLVTEYDYKAIVLRDGEIAEVDTLDELEHFDDTPLGHLEAFTTSGGTSTAPYTFRGKLKNYEYKTFRFPGHAALMRVYKDFGLWREDEIEVKGTKVRPKDVFCQVFGEELGKIKDRDQCVIRAIGLGEKDGEAVTRTIDIHDLEDPETGFTSMERLTGFSLSIVAQHITRSSSTRGALRYEMAMPGSDFVAAIRERGIQLHER